MRVANSLIALSLLIAVSFSADSQQLKLRQYMTAQEFQEAGLRKLSEQEMQALEQWFNRHTVAIYRLAQGGAGTSQSGTQSTQSYLVDNAANDETFLVNGKIFKAKTYCMSLNKGDRVIVVGGTAGMCMQAKLINLRNQSVCEVWCE